MTNIRYVSYSDIALYIANACRWAVDHSWPDMFYWLSALAITATVTWGYAH